MGAKPDSLVIAKAKTEIAIIPKMANRHGLIAGATGTGKTVTLRTLAEQFSAIGTPVFMADVKGDLSGLPFPGGENPKVNERIQKLGCDDFVFQGFPVAFWDVFGEQGHPVRATVSDLGPLQAFHGAALRFEKTAHLAVLAFRQLQFDHTLRAARGHHARFFSLKSLALVPYPLSEPAQHLRLDAPLYGGKVFLTYPVTRMSQAQAEFAVIG